MAKSKPHTERAAEPAASAKQSDSPSLFQDYERRKQRAERLVMFSSVSFILAIGVLIWYSKGEVVTSTVKFLQSFESAEKNPGKNLILNCQKAANKNTPYCQERKGDIEATWSGITRYQGQTPAFTLHGKGG